MNSGHILAVKRSWPRLLLCCALITTLLGCGTGGSTSAALDAQAADTDIDDGGTTDDGDTATVLLNIVTAAERNDYLNIMLDDFTTVVATATAGSATPFADLPITGTATYDGYMQLILGNANVSANIIGDAIVDVNLTDNAITGQATGFLGIAEDIYGFSQVASYDGVVDISDGSFAENDDGNTAIEFDIAGSLDNGRNVFDVQGTLIGALYNGAAGLHAIGSYTQIHGNAEVTIDGSTGSNYIAIATVSGLER